jgi:predicted  nucleic acid-binding Zn-ribbon protein
MDDITNRRFDKMENGLSHLRGDLAALQADVTGLKADVTGLKVEVTGLKVDVTGLRTDVTDLKVDSRELKIELREMKSDIARHFRELMEEGQRHGVLLGRLTAWLDDDTRARVIKLEERLAQLERLAFGPKQ